MDYIREILSVAASRESSEARARNNVLAYRDFFLSNNTVTN